MKKKVEIPKQVEETFEIEVRIPTSRKFEVVEVGKEYHIYQNGVKVGEYDNKEKAENICSNWNRKYGL